LNWAARIPAFFVLPPRRSNRCWRSWERS